jgi:nitrite reductase (NADH) large subunit
MAKTWKCDLCGYVHNGDTAPQSCPVCGADSNHFSILQIKTSAVAVPAADAWQCSICDHIAPAAEPPQLCPVCGAAAALFHPFTARGRDAAAVDVRKILILGAGIAGLTAAEEARRQSPEVQVTLVSRERVLPYYRLNLTRFLAGEVAEADLLIQHQAWFDSQKIEYLAGEAHAIVPSSRKVTLRDGRELGYDRLILANGAHPFIPPIPGVNREGVMVLRTLENARKAIDYLHPKCRVVCLGGGLLGLETAWAMLKRGADVTVLEGFGWLLPRQLPPAAAALLGAHLKSKRMSIECDIQVKEFTGDEAVRGVLLEMAASSRPTW